jgi:hypothetical protein
MQSGPPSSNLSRTHSYSTTGTRAFRSYVVFSFGNHYPRFFNTTEDPYGVAAYNRTLWLIHSFLRSPEYHLPERVAYFVGMIPGHVNCFDYYRPIGVYNQTEVDLGA